MKTISILIMLALLGLSNIANAQQAGTLDTTFNPETTIETIVKASALQSDGKVIIGGIFSKGIARLNTDGSLDNTFVTGTGTDAEVSAIAIQSDGKIIIGGYFTSYNGKSMNRIARLNTDGTLDATFIAGTGIMQTWAWGWALSDLPGATIHTIALQNDGKIFIGGFFDVYNGTAIANLARLNTNGTLDTTFIANRIGGSVWSIAIQNDDKVIIGVGYYSPKCHSYSGNVVRINSCGTVDSTFNGCVCGSIVKTIALQNDGKIIIGGDYSGYCDATTQTYANGITRLNNDGTLDTTFLLNQIVSAYYIDVNTIVIQNDGKIIVGARDPVSYSNETENLIFRLNTNGTLDNSFTPGVGAIGARDIYTVAVQSDDKIIIGGNFTAYNGTGRNGVARLNGDNILSVGNHINYGVDESSIIPNPNNGIFSLQLNEEIRNTTIHIIDVFGKEVYNSTFNTQQSIHDIDISNQAKGLYYIIINNKDKQYRNKVIVK